MALGFAMLAHTRLDRAGAVARHLAGQGAPVVVHLDPRSTEPNSREQLSAEGIDMVSDHAAEWGRFGMIDATWAAVAPLLKRPQVTHVCLISGACLPLRSVAEMNTHVAAHPDADFIEAVPVTRDKWVEDGLSEERLTLYHPFSHRDQKGLFDACVDVQRFFRIRRRLPKGLKPHLGSQWWCLSADTLRAIRDHPNRACWDRFFRWSWIPDEGYFQSLVPLVNPEGERHSPLHMGGFNMRGRPYVFHDDHLRILTRAEGFLARKIDPDAGALYEHFLSRADKDREPGQTIDFDRARSERTTEGRGQLSMARLPKGTTLTRTETIAPYVALLAPDGATCLRLHRLLAAQGSCARMHGRLFAPGKPPAFAEPSELYGGNLPADPVLRDYRPAQFLSRLNWWDREVRPAFWMAPEDDHPVRIQLVNDPNARLVILGAADARLTSLRRGFPRVKGPKLPLRAWVRSVDGLPDDDLTKQLAAILSSDWNDPAGWQVPG